MDEYVSKEEVLSRIYATHSTGGFANEEAYLWLHDEVTNLSSSDVQLVKHGKWVKSATQKHVEVTYECSECQHEVVGEYEKTPFCGGCGARMEGDIDETD